jgi:hypothetical protein
VDEHVSQALSNWRPSADATASIGRTDQYAPELAPFEDPRYEGTARSDSVHVKQPLFRGFRTKAETEAAEKAALAGRAKLESAEQQLFLDTASAYLGILRDEAVLELERNHERVLELLGQEWSFRDAHDAFFSLSRSGASDGNFEPSGGVPLIDERRYGIGRSGSRTAIRQEARRGAAELPVRD